MRIPVARLGIVIVAHDHCDELHACLDSLEGSAKAAEARIVVRDCASLDGTAQMATVHGLAPLVIEGTNVGFGAACNEGAAALGGDVDMLLFLNPDTRVEFVLQDLLDYVERFGAFGCVGIKQYSFRGELVWSWDQFPGPRPDWAKARRCPLVQRSEDGYREDRVVDWVMGSFLLVPTDAFHAAGGFDDSLFLFDEEVDLCRRLKTTGREVYYVDAFSYQHQRENKDTLWREVLRINSRRRNDRKWLSRRERLACQLVHSYRWLTHLRHPVNPADRRLILPRLLATWNLLHAQLPNRSTRGPLQADQAGHLHLGRSETHRT